LTRMIRGASSRARVRISPTAPPAETATCRWGFSF